MAASRWLGLVALSALAACATAEPTVASPPPSFRAVRALVLVRSAGGRSGGAKDPLDALDESLRARGYTTRIVELGPRRPELTALRKLFDDLDARAGEPQSERFGTLPYGDAGGGARAAVAALGVDAVAAYHRFEPQRVLPETAGPLLPGMLFRGPADEPQHGPLGALSVVDREGHVATFAWGETTALDDPTTPANAAEAVDLVVRALAGELE